MFIVTLNHYAYPFSICFGRYCIHSIKNTRIKWHSMTTALRLPVDMPTYIRVHHLSIRKLVQVVSNRSKLHNTTHPI